MRALVSGAVAGVTAAVALRLLRDRPPGGAQVWDRTNHAGRTVTLLEGPAYAVGAATGAGWGAGAGIVGECSGAGAASASTTSLAAAAAITSPMPPITEGPVSAKEAAVTAEGASISAWLRAAGAAPSSSTSGR